MPKQIVFTAVTFLHDLFTAIWIGGLLTLGLSVLPAIRQSLGAGPQTKQLMSAIQRRLSVAVYVSIVVLAVTGLLLGNRAPAYQGLFSFANPYSAVLSVKHVVVLAMVAIALLRSLALGRMGTLQAAKREKLSAALLFLNIALGVLVLLLSAYSAALSSSPPSP